MTILQRSSSARDLSSKRGRQVRPFRVSPKPQAPFGLGIDAFDAEQLARDLADSASDLRAMSEAANRRRVQPERVARAKHTAADLAFWSSQHILAELGVIPAPGVVPDEPTVIEPEADEAEMWLYADQPVAFEDFADAEADYDACDHLGSFVGHCAEGF